MILRASRRQGRIVPVSWTAQRHAHSRLGEGTEVRLSAGRRVLYLSAGEETKGLHRAEVR